MQVATNPLPSTLDDLCADAVQIVIDAGIEHLQIRYYGPNNTVLGERFYPSSDIQQFLDTEDLHGSRGFRDRSVPIYITGKLAEVLRSHLGQAQVIQPAAALWAAARTLFNLPENGGYQSLAVIDLSASGYHLVGIDAEGMLRNDLLVVNPRCGAGTGANIDRVLQKLDLSRDQVDTLLSDYLGKEGEQARGKLTVRADRCGVFSSSATISDKNQGIPLEYALAVTLKSEVMKSCNRLTPGFEKVYLTGGVFRWQFTRDCAADYLRGIGVRDIAYDTDQSALIKGVHSLVDNIGESNFLRPEYRLKKATPLIELPSFRALKAAATAQNLYRRLPDMDLRRWNAGELQMSPIIVALDVGSTMAKFVIADALTGDPLVLNSYSNHGDTIETIKHIFRDLQSQGVRQLNIAHIGITGSARYQVQEALREIFPQLKEKVSVLVENYAHARGSIDQARDHIRHLKSLGVEEINEDFFVLVDIGGEDTKLSTISLKKGELYDNAMNVKCSAGTGSLMDSLSALFGIGSVGEASRRAFDAEKAFAINATCAVFLIENARKLQTLGYSKDEILASCSWAIVENMAQTLWDQVDLPKNAVVLLHGQTMLSDPLPLAVTQRLQEYLGAPSYALVPSNPGHRACFGLIRTLIDQQSLDPVPCTLEYFLSRQFKKRIVQCRGIACGDKAACCNRTLLSFPDTKGQRTKLTLGGCTAINEFLALKKAGIKVDSGRDTYKEIWEYINGRLPHSEAADRLVIPRSFAVSEWAYFFARIFHHLGLPVHADNVREADLITAQPRFDTDTCAPQIGAVGQYLRLAREPHGMILVPQLEYLPTGGTSFGRTCTINQGGGLVAKNIAEADSPDARFHLFHLDLSNPDAEFISHQLHQQLAAVFKHYGIRPTSDTLLAAVRHALDDNRAFKAELEDMAADIIETALREERQVGIVVGREYVLNPGIYDSHVGRLMRDKQIVALPAYLMDTQLDQDYSHLYWRNPHTIVSVLRAAAEKRLHEILTNPRLKELFRQIETESAERLLPVVQVSTFRCGPDSVTTSLVAEIMKKRPFLLIQSDAVIQELAHLENRMNTYAKQLEQGLHSELMAGGEPFDIRILDGFTNSQALDREKDVIYFPTLSDNRTVTTVIRAAGFTCIDNYSDDTYSLVELVKKGRRFTGDSVCAPLAAVYGDIVLAVEDFLRRKKRSDPLVAGKQRVLVFTNKGTGPCRQGQYSEAQKLYAYQTFGTPKGINGDETRSQTSADPIMQLLVGEESSGYNFGIDEWAVVRAFQGVILQGVLHALLFKCGSQCRDFSEYQQFLTEFRQLKQELYRILENKPGPGEKIKKVLRRFGDGNTAAAIKYFAYRLHDRDLHRKLRSFSRKWNRGKQADGLMKIYIDGEAYMRTSQAEDIFQLLLSSVGFRRFDLEYSPVWYYLAYLLDEEEMVNTHKLQSAQRQLRNCSAEKRVELSRTISGSKASLSKTKGLRFLLREILARPLYRAAGVSIPAAMPATLQVAEQLMSTLRPFGELGPYIGEVVSKLRKGYDLCLNVAPEGCMVASMGATLTHNIISTAASPKGRIQNLFSADGEVDEELLTQAVLKVLGPDGYYRATASAE